MSTRERANAVRPYDRDLAVLFYSGPLTPAPGRFSTRMTMIELNETHDPKLQSFVASANDPASDFPIQNLPLGVFTHNGSAAKAGVAIGDQVLDLCGAHHAGLLDGDPARAAAACQAGRLNELMALGPEAAAQLRRRVSHLLASDSPRREQVEHHLIPISEVVMQLPASIGDYTDFYASIHHATNVGSMFRPDNPLLPNYKWVPIGYHGRSSSIVVSGTPVRRPNGQTQEGDAPPVFGPTRRLDYEMEVGFFVGTGNTQGESISIDQVEEHIFGLCLVNDWSARDVQAWEYQPLGPFLAKNFATSISPWIVSLEALAPFRVEAFEREVNDPQPLPYLSSSAQRERGGLDVTLEVLLLTEKMRLEGAEPALLSRGNLRDIYWTIGQLLTHHASNGCNLRPGDLLASGTVSGASKQSRGSMLERAWRGSEPVDLPNGESRKFINDGDQIIMRGYCQREGYARIGFGECVGTVVSS